VNQLRHAQPGGVQNFDERAIPQATRCRNIRLRDEPLDLFDAEKLWESRPRPRRLKVVGRIGGEVLREHGKPEKTSYGGHSARDRARREPFVHQAVDKMFEVAAVQALNRFFEAGGELSKPLEIAAVAFKSVVGQAAFYAKMREICIDEIMGG
jgi:hypothetical protein